MTTYEVDNFIKSLQISGGFEYDFLKLFFSKLLLLSVIDKSCWWAEY